MRRIPKKYIELFVAILVGSMVLFPSVIMGYEKEINMLSEKLKEQLQNSGKKRVAVVDFTDLKGNINELGRFIAEELSTGLLASGGKFEIVDRAHLQVLLKENKLSATGLVDPKDAQKVVKLSGVDALITGNITSFNDSFRLSVKILDAENAKLIGATKGNIPATGALTELANKEIRTISYNSGTSGEVSKPVKTEFNVEKKVEKNGIMFALQGCKRNRKNVKCNFLVTAIEEDLKSIYIYANKNNRSSYFFDSSGNVHYAQRILFGNVMDNQGVKNDLYQDNPIMMTFEFDEVDQQVNIIKTLTIFCDRDQYDDGENDFVVTFTNISIH
jgi:TolB-like protein